MYKFAPDLFIGSDMVIYMSENSSIKKGAEIGNKTSVRGRQRSTIGFPYVTMPDVEKLAQAIHSHVGNGSCEDGQLAAWSSQSAKSSTFRMQIAAARLFGIIETEGDGYRLTALGRQIMDPASARSAKVEAFLNVPLFKALYESHKDGVLPPPAALEREIADLGVSLKQKDRARQVFERSAENAGFFESGKNRLVKPAVTGKTNIPDPPQSTIKTRGNGGGDGNSPNLDPLLTALLWKIPPTGEAWDAEKRLRWFKTFAMNVSQIYDNEGDPVEFDIRLAKGFSTSSD